ncbi:MAG: hypothetical protein IJ510_02465 [Selenomonadales bacterium]|nr:hypothetical protein [Selenomonadales bacterium]
MTNRELENTLAVLEFVSSVLTIQLLLQSRMGLDDDSFLEEEYRGTQDVEERLILIERRLERLEKWLGIR